MIISSGVYLLYVVLPSLIFSSYTGADLGGYFVGVFSKTIIPLALVGYEMIIANSYPTRTRGIIVKYITTSSAEFIL